MMNGQMSVMDFVNRPNVGHEIADMGDVLPDPEDYGDQEVWALKMKKKRRQQLLKQMLMDAGYDDLAKMTSVSEEQV